MRGPRICHPIDLLDHMMQCDGYQQHASTSDGARIKTLLKAYSSITTSQTSGWTEPGTPLRSKPGAAASLTIRVPENDTTMGYSLRLRCVTRGGAIIAEDGLGFGDRDHIDVTYQTSERAEYAAKALGLTHVQPLMILVAHMSALLPRDHAIRVRRHAMDKRPQSWLGTALMSHCGCFVDIGGAPLTSESMRPAKKKTKLQDLRE